MTFATSTSKPRTFDGSLGSASTYGAPPSASPPQVRKGDCGTGGLVLRSEALLRRVGRGDGEICERRAREARSGIKRVRPGGGRRPVRVAGGGERSSKSRVPSRTPRRGPRTRFRRRRAG